MRKHLLTRAFANRPSAFVLAAGLLLAALVGGLDYLTGVEVSLSILYLLPIALVAWYAPRWAAFTICLVSTAMWLVADYAGGYTYSQWLILVENAAVRLGFFLIVGSLLVSLRTQLGRERLAMGTDELRNVLNGQAFAEVCGRLLRLAGRHRHPLTVAYVAIDDLKAVDDSQDQLAGDTPLQTVAATIVRSIRRSDVVGRLDGDRFAVLMPETGRHGAQAAFGKIDRLLKNEADQHGWPVSFSIGVALFRTPPASLDEALEMADDLMSRVKQQGKHSVLYEDQVVSLLAKGNGRHPYPQPGTSEEQVTRALSGR